jgi:nicotinate-nucleotide--dimethylbenzimidazole phosphoribosyltransferase
MSSESVLKALLDAIEPVDAAWIDRARERQLQLTKPPESLGRLEEIANRMAAIQRTLSPAADRARVVIFAADHGICEEGVNPYPQAVTAQMAANFLRGGAAINALAEAAGADLEIVDMGIATEIPLTEGLVRRPIGQGTRNFCRVAAMSRDQVLAAVLAGAERATQAAADGCRILGIGEMGIGNTTSASAITAALTGLPAASVIGRGTGADDNCMSRKLAAVERALALHQGQLNGPLEILAAVGGLEIAAMCGFCLGAAAHRCAVLVDGFIATASAALAVELRTAARDYLFASHRSTEPGHAPLLDRIGQQPLLELKMRLGEGTGAALALPIVRAAIAAFTRMATFQSAGVSDAGVAAG